MTESEIETFVTALEDVQTVVNFGYTFFFVGEDHRLPFVTIGHSDNDFDNVSRLDRDGVFRVNIGVSKETFSRVTSDQSDVAVDYTVLDRFLPHPHYAKQHFVCILNPSGDNAGVTKTLIREAHAIAVRRQRRRANNNAVDGDVG